MRQQFSGGIDIYGSKKPVSMGTNCLGTICDRNTDRMSLDEKIYHGTKKYQSDNPSINPEIAKQDRKSNIERETQEIIKGHKS